MAECALTEEQPFRVFKQLGEGGYGTVHLVDHIRLGTVAYKTCPGASTDRQAELKAEAEQHRTLRHPNVVTLYDTVFNSTCCGLFIEYMKYGSVIEFIKRFKVPSELRIQILYETACGMFYLHGNQPAIIHGDLSSQNILIGEGFHAKIADFGLSRTMKETYETSTTVTPFRGKPIYIAPEYFKDPRKRKSEKFDVYGFAISAWEILSQKRAYHDYADMRWLPIFVERGERPDMKEIDESIPSTVKQLIEKCWYENDENRPSFKFIKNELCVHVSKLQSEVRRAYVSLTSQEDILHLSNAMETCGISNTGTIPMGEHKPEVNRSTDKTVISKRCLVASLQLIDLCTLCKLQVRFLVQALYIYIYIYIYNIYIYIYIYIQPRLSGMHIVSHVNIENSGPSKARENIKSVKPWSLCEWQANYD